MRESAANSRLLGIHVGTKVTHPEHGAGVVRTVVDSPPGVTVKFAALENRVSFDEAALGALTDLSQQLRQVEDKIADAEGHSARDVQKLQQKCAALKKASTTLATSRNDRMICLHSFQRAALKVVDTSPASLEALYLTLKVASGVQHEEVVETDTGISMQLLLEFLGDAPAPKSPGSPLGGTKSVSARMTRSGSISLGMVSTAVLRLSNRSGSSRGSNRSTDAPLWQHSQVEKKCREVCSELQNSLDPIALFRWSHKNSDNEAKLMGLFCMSAWIAPHIPDYANIGAYSKSRKAKVYRLAAKQVPLPRLFVQLSRVLVPLPR